MQDSNLKFLKNRIVTATDKKSDLVIPILICKSTIPDKNQKSLTDLSAQRQQYFRKFNRTRNYPV